MARIPNHPGKILEGELTELQMSAAELARILHVPANRISQIIAGKRAITADTALRLSQWLGTTPEFWLSLQTNFDLALTKQQLGSEIKRSIAKYKQPSNAARPVA